MNIQSKRKKNNFGKIFYLKIIIIGPGFPLRGGIANFNAALSKAFIKQGDDCEIVSFSLQYPKILFPGKTQYEEGEAPKDVNIFPLVNSINPFNWRKVSNYIKNQKPDLIIPVFWLPFTGISIGQIIRKLKRTKTPIISLVHNVVPHDKKIGDSFFSKRYFNQCDAFVTLSQAVTDDIQKFVKTPVCKIIPHPVYDIFGDAVSRESALKKLDLFPGFRYLLFFGLVKEYKGLEVLIEALSNPIIKNQKIKLIVAGEFYEDRKQYNDLIRRLDISSHVIIYDKYISAEEVKYFFSASDIVVQPYKTATQSGVTQVAYHFNKPMIVTDVGGLKEIVPNEKVGFVVEKENPEQIAQAINKFYVNKKENFFIENIKKEKQRFSWDAMANGFKSLLAIIKKP